MGRMVRRREVGVGHRRVVKARRRELSVDVDVKSGAISSIVSAVDLLGAVAAVEACAWSFGARGVLR
jgi:hypothetical protein